MDDDYEYGSKFGRPDIERVGLFGEMPRFDGRPVKKKPYVRQLPNCLASSTKEKCATNDGYFSPFIRVFEKEAIARPTYSKNKKGKSAIIPWNATGPAKFHSTPGDLYGTFTKEMPSFGAPPKPKTIDKKRKYFPNFVTNPGKKGNAGYPNICLNPYPEHSVDRYGAKMKIKVYGKQKPIPWSPWSNPQPFFEKNVYYEEEGGKTYIPPKGPFRPFRLPGYWTPTGPSKMKGGNNGGCINKFPEAVPDRYISHWEIFEKGRNKDPVSKSGRKWAPQTRGPKSMYTSSILHANTDLRVNAKTWKTYRTNYTKYLL